LASGDPLAFGIGDIQGIEVKISSFRATNDGAFSLNLDYEIWDHFGSNDGDLYDNAQACLWLLQRKKIKDHDKQAFMPFRIKIVLKNVAGSGKVSQPAGLQYDWRGRPYQE
jgi:hypothetical protein